MVIVLVLVLLAVIGIVVMVVLFKKADEQAEATNNILKQRFSGLENFEASRTIEHGDFIFAIDKNNRQVAYVDVRRVKVIPFDQIYKVEYLENSTTVASKSSIRTIGGALVGGALAGGSGAIVGGLSGDTTMKNKITLMQVKIGLRDINSPSLTIYIYKDREGLDSSSGFGGVLYQAGLKYVNDIVDSISVIIDSVDNENKLQTSDSVSQSVADELSKLLKLKENGILTENEFEEQKQKLLNK